MEYDWDWSFLTDWEIVKALLRALGTTLSLTFWCVILGTPLGVGLGALASLGLSPERLTASGAGLVNRSRRPIRAAMTALRWIVITYIDSVRAVPLLLLMITTYYALPQFEKVQPVATVLHACGLGPFGGYAAAVVAMSINLSAFVADIVRGATGGLARGSILAGRALGMKEHQIWRYIALPEVVREIYPSLVLLYITMLKMSTLASTVTVYEMLHTADAIIQNTYKPLELYLSICVLFVAVIVPASFAARRLEKTRWLRRRST